MLSLIAFAKRPIYTNQTNKLSTALRIFNHSSVAMIFYTLFGIICVMVQSINKCVQDGFEMIIWVVCREKGGTILYIRRKIAKMFFGGTFKKKNNTSLLLMPENKKNMLALLGGLHKRIGFSSPIFKYHIDTHSMSLVYSYLVPPPIPLMIYGASFDIKGGMKERHTVIPFVYKDGKLEHDKTTGRLSTNLDVRETHPIPIFPFPLMCIKYRSSITSIEITDTENNTIITKDMRAHTKFNCIVHGVCYLVDIFNESNPVVYYIQSNSHVLHKWEDMNKKGAFAIAAGNDCVAMAIDKDMDEWIVYTLNQDGIANNNNGIPVSMEERCFFFPSIDKRCMGLCIQKNTDRYGYPEDGGGFNNFSLVSSLDIAYVVRDSGKVIKKRFAIGGRMVQRHESISSIAIKETKYGVHKHTISAAVIPQYPPLDNDSDPINLQWTTVEHFFAYYTLPIFLDTVAILDRHSNTIIYWLTVDKSGLLVQSTTVIQYPVHDVVGLSNLDHIATVICTQTFQDDHVYIINCTNGKILGEYEGFIRFVCPIESWKSLLL
jgi:hypothetical protein